MKIYFLRLKNIPGQLFSRSMLAVSSPEIEKISFCLKNRVNTLFHSLSFKHRSGMQWIKFPYRDIKIIPRISGLPFMSCFSSWRMKKSPLFVLVSVFGLFWASFFMYCRNWEENGTHFHSQDKITGMHSCNFILPIRIIVRLTFSVLVLSTLLPPSCHFFPEGMRISAKGSSPSGIKSPAITAKAASKEYGE